MNKLLVITGPTATGKTALGIELAKKFNGEIISADSQQVYKGNDIETGKDKDLYGDIPVWGLDLLEPEEKFSASAFVELARETISDITSRGKLPITVGCTGHYLRALLDPFATLNISPDEKLRSKSFELEELQKRLQDLDPIRWEHLNRSDRKNPRRLIRAIETADSNTKSKEVDEKYDALIIGLTAPRDFIIQKIIQRRYDRPDLVARETQQAKKQFLYQRKFLPAKWFDITDPEYRDKIIKTVKKWYDRQKS